MVGNLRRPRLNVLGFRHAPPVNHSQGWRDRETGFHSNDCASENSRLKQWLRGRYSKLGNATVNSNSYEDYDLDPLNDLQALDIYEYVHYVNIGKSMHTVMRSLASIGGGAFPPIDAALFR